MKGNMMREGMLQKKIMAVMILSLLLVAPAYYVFPVNADDPPTNLTLKWTYDTGLTFSGGIGPLTADVNKDGKMEIFASGDYTNSGDKIFCFNGNTGAVIWSIKPSYQIVPHNPMEIYDLNKDGIPELIQPSPNGIMVYHANNGTLYWKNQSIKCSEAHQLVLDTDKNGYP